MSNQQNFKELTPFADSTDKNLSDLIVEYLELLGVEYVFGVPGGHISALWEALDRSAARGGPRMVMSRHETGAAAMADGYARETGKLGVCCATTGPGATNLITGVSESYAAHTPLLVITAQTAVPRFGAGAFQESSPDLLDTAGLFEHCTNYSTVVTHARQMEPKLLKALRYALHAPGGPAHISIPVDLSRAPMPDGASYPHIAARLRQPNTSVDTTALATLHKMVTETLQKGEKVALFVGHDCRTAADEITAFAELVNAEIITTQAGKAWVNDYHPLVRGVFGYAGHTTARAALEDESVGLILGLGSRMGQWATSSWDAAIMNDKLVHIHPRPDYFPRTPMARLHLLGDVRTVLASVHDHVKTSDVTLKPFVAPILPDDAYGTVPAQIDVLDIAGYQTDAVPTNPQRTIWEMMQRRFPADTRFIVDACNWMPWTFHYYFNRHPGTYHVSTEFATMGWGMGAAVGTALGSPGTPVVCLTGDGSYLMNGQELTVAVQEKLPLILFINNDSGYGMVQHRHYDVAAKPLDFPVPCVDFSLMARAIGADGYRITHPEQWETLDFEAMCNRPGPTVIDVVIDKFKRSPQGMF